MSETVTDADKLVPTEGAEMQPAEIPANIPAKHLGGSLTFSQGKVAPENMAQAVEFAQLMCKAGTMLPAHLRGNPGACLGVVMDAMAWNMNPFAVARFHMEVNGVGSYMSQLITSVINSRAPIKGRLFPMYAGKGNELVCRIEAETREGQVLVYESPPFAQIQPKNSPLWKSDPEQQIFYYSARAWARRYFPDLLMGVYDPEEAAMMKDVTPKQPDNFLEDEPTHQSEVRTLRRDAEQDEPEAITR